MLDDGHITDSQGRKVDFSNTVIIMTSNAGAKAIVEPKKLGFATKEDPASDYKKMKQNVMDEVKQIFRPEFLNRVDDIVVFKPLGEDQIRSIVRLILGQLGKRLQSQMELTLEATDEAVDALAKEGFDPAFGARPLKRLIVHSVETIVSQKIVQGDIVSGDHLKVVLKNGKIDVVKA